MSVVLTLTGECVVLRELARQRKVTRQTIYNGTVPDSTDPERYQRREIEVGGVGRPPDNYRFPNGEIMTIKQAAHRYHAGPETLRRRAVWHPQDHMWDIADTHVRGWKKRKESLDT
jgi:hypothetical protein